MFTFVHSDTIHVHCVHFSWEKSYRHPVFNSNFVGSEFLYSTHGYTLLAAVIENVTGVPFQKVKSFKQIFFQLTLTFTYCPKDSPYSS